MTIYLPVMTASRPKQSALLQDPWRGSGRLLWVEEDEAELRAARKLVERLGLTILEARNTEEASTLFERHHAEVDLMILGTSVLRRGGVIALKTLRELDHRVPVVVSMAYDEPGNGLLPDDLAGTLKKPIRIAEFQKLLKRTLPSPGAEARTG